MTYQEMKSIIEGLLFAAGDEGLDAKQIAEVLEITIELASDLVYDMQADFRREQRGIQIVEIADLFQFTTLPEHAGYFERLMSAPARAVLSQAALETLAIVAYKQPITRVDIEEIRGVNCDRALQTLVAKQLVKELGRAEAVGRPILYGTTKQFLDHFGLRNLKELPESTAFASEQALEEETKRLFEKLEDKQLSFDDLT